MRPAIKSKLLNKRRWALVIKSFTRDATALELHEDGIINDIRTTIIISIRDPKNKGVIYSEGIRLLNAFNFEHTNISINNDIQLLGTVGD